MDVKKLTRAKAERLVARTEDYETLRELETHPNKHVGQKVRFKLLAPVDRVAATAAGCVNAGLSALSNAEAKS
jgi:hypothetical protein